MSYRNPSSKAELYDLFSDSDKFLDQSRVDPVKMPSVRDLRKALYHLSNGSCDDRSIEVACDALVASIQRELF